MLVVLKIFQRSILKVESGNLIVKKRRVVFVFDDENGFDFLFFEMMEVEVKFFFLMYDFILKFMVGVMVLLNKIVLFERKI